MSSPLLSIAIPAYRYRDGIERILCSLPLDDPRIEIIIGDDTPDNDICSWINKEGTRNLLRNLKYHHNIPSLGAVSNWNDLISRATGKYLWLLHHDECPLDVKCVYQIIALLNREPAPDTIILDCILVLNENGNNRRHMPSWIQSFVARKYPNYLLRRNVIGPPSTIVARKDLYEKYNVNLHWLVDVEQYRRLFLNTNIFYFAKDISIISLPYRKDSITALLQLEINDITRAERITINKMNYHFYTKHPLVNHSISQRILDALEYSSWKMLRFAIRIPSLLGLCTFSRSKVRKALIRKLQASRVNK